MPTQALGKRSDAAAMDLDDKLETLQTKFQKAHNLKECCRSSLLLLISQRSFNNLILTIFSSANWENNQVSQSTKQIFDFQATITKALHDTIPLDPNTVIKYTAYQLNPGKP
jgi:Rad3-related DNA helicase